MAEGFVFNHEDVFSSIKVLTVNPETNNVNNFMTGMNSNYHLSEGHDHLFNDDGEFDEESHEMIHKEMDMLASLAYWEDKPANYVDELTTGTIFKGICKADSFMRMYVVVGKYDNHSIWYPIDGDRKFFMCILWAFDVNEQEFKPMMIDEYDQMELALIYGVEPDNIYKITDINGNPISINDEDDDMDFEDENDPISCTYFVYKNDEEENGYISIARMSEVMEHYQVFRPLMSAFVGSLHKESEEATEEN